MRSNEIRGPFVRGESVLIVCAHPDDEVLGCGGTAALWARQGLVVHTLMLADGETSRASGSAEAVSARHRAAEAACKALGGASAELLSLPDNRLDGVDLLDVVTRIEGVIERYRPTVVVTHHAGDVNIDHRVVHDAVIAACRPQPGHSVRTLLFFEVPSSTEWRPPASGPTFSPNWFVDISATLTDKLEALRCYESELRPFPHPRSIEGVEALARWRGATIGVAAAEAFELGRCLF